MPDEDLEDGGRILHVVPTWLSIAVRKEKERCALRVSRFLDDCVLDDTLRLKVIDRSEHCRCIFFVHNAQKMEFCFEALKQS